MRWADASIAALCVMLFGAAARGDYIASPRWDGKSAATVAPGESFDLDIVLDSDASDEHIACLLRVVFSSPGLVYESYEWRAPYDNGTIDDASIPLAGDLPQALAADTMKLAGYPADAVDVLLSNSTDSPSGPPPKFGTGTLVTLSLTVPVDYSGPQTLTIDVVPDEFFAGFVGGQPAYVDWTAGQSFELTVPEPATLALLAVGLVFWPRHRRAPRRP